MAKGGWQRNQTSLWGGKTGLERHSLENIG